LKFYVKDILQNKITEIQSRIPLPIKTPSFSVTFANILENITSETVNKEFQLNTEKKEYSLISGSYEDDYPRLSSDEISILMPRIDAAIKNASCTYGIGEYMIRAIIKQESSFQPFALSTSGAMGLMQLMPDTAGWLSVGDPYNIEENINGGTQYFRDQLNAFDGNTELALAAYNAGPNNVIKYNGIPPFAQTQDFVKKVMQYYNSYVLMKSQK